MLQNFVSKLLEYGPRCIGRTGIYFLSKFSSPQKGLIKQIFETALDRKTVDDNEVILQENDVDITIGELTGYPLISEAVEKVHHNFLGTWGLSAFLVLKFPLQIPKFTVSQKLSRKLSFSNYTMQFLSFIFKSLWVSCD